jgi:DNA ligase (NAD+)
MKIETLKEETSIYLKKDIPGFTEKDAEIFQNVMKEHSRLYYELEAPIITDFEYDTLFKKLQVLELQF